MTRYRTFSGGQVFPADFPNALGDFLGSAVENFQLIIKPGTTNTLQVPAGPDNAKAAISINGRWRYNEASVERASPGGAAGTMTVWVTASDNVFTGGAAEVDSTNYAFGLAVLASGTPTGVALSRQVGTAQWDGTKFTSVTQTAPPVPGGVAPVTPLVTSLPAGVEGSEVFYEADPTNGVMWRLRYRAALPGWECVGGPPLFAETLGTITPNRTGNYETDGASPTITVPRAGVYGVRFGAYLVVGGGAFMTVAFTTGTLTPPDEQAISLTTTATGAPGTAVSAMRSCKPLSISAGATVHLLSKQIYSGLDAIAQFPWIEVYPVHIS